MEPIRTRGRSLALAGLISSLVASCTQDPVAVPERSEVVAVTPPPVVDPAERQRLLARARAAEEAEARVRAEADASARVEAERAEFEAAYPLHGVAFHFLAPIRREPSSTAASLGYLRRGATFRASARVAGRGCERGWHKLPGDGFVCRGEGVTIGETPQSFSPSPVPPSLEDALPYPYAYSARASTAQYFRIPTAAEETQTAALFTRLDAQRAALAQAIVAADGGVPTQAEASADVEAPPPPGQTAEATDAAESDDGLPDFVRMQMQRGFYVSVDGTDEADDGRRFLRTVRGAYVPASSLTPNEPPTHRGVALGGSWHLPVGFVYRVGAHRLSRDPITSELVDQGALPQDTSFVVSERFVRGSTAYLVADDGWIVRETAARVARLAERPSEVPEGAKWIHIDLSDQILVAYDGATPAFTTTVSTGREGHSTPTGVFRIQSKHVSTTMDDLAAGDEAYSIEDVPWTMYFQGNFALHGAFWHNQFGRVRSHGCVNLSPPDARYLFGFATPTLPQSWHGVFSSGRNAGTYVVIVP